MVAPAHVCDESVFESIFRSLSKSLRDFMYFKCGDADLSADIVQEVFVKMWEKCKDIPPDKAKSFLFTAAHNRFLNNVEKQKVRMNYVQASQPKVNTEDPAYVMEVSEYKQKLDDAIAALPEGQREVFLMNRVAKLTYAEIARKLEVSQKAVEKRMSKALLKLRDVLHPKQS